MSENRIEAVVGLFQDAESANRATTEMRLQNVEFQHVSENALNAANQMPEIVYDPVENVKTNDVMGGILKGGAIGAGSGLLFIGVPVLNIAAPITGAIAGGWIGGVAAIDEAIRGIELPDQQTYQQRLAEGKSLVVIFANESDRMEYAKQLKILGAIEVNQHPPVLEASFHDRQTQA